MDGKARDKHKHYNTVKCHSRIHQAMFIAHILTGMILSSKNGKANQQNTNRNTKHYYLSRIHQAIKYERGGNAIAEYTKQC